MNNSVLDPKGERVGEEEMKKSMRRSKEERRRAKTRDRGKVFKCLWQLLAIEARNFLEMTNEIRGSMLLKAERVVWIQWQQIRYNKGQEEGIRQQLKQLSKLGTTGQARKVEFWS